MNKQDYDKYYQQGGSYVIPVEIFNELFEDYECFKNDCKKYKEVINKTINDIDLVIELIKQQPTEDDSWILDRLNAFNIILKEAYKEVE